MKKTVILLFGLLTGIYSFGQVDDDNVVVPSKPIPLTIYLAPVLDGASFAAEWTFKSRYSINLYALKRKSESSIYYGTKVNENLTELMLKIYTSKSPDKKFRTFFGPCLGKRNIVFDQQSFFMGRFFGGGIVEDDFFGNNPDQVDQKAKAGYIVPMYFGFDYNSKRGLIFEYAAGISFQKSSGNTNISGPVIEPYTQGINWRSRFLFGYKF